MCLWLILYCFFLPSCCLSTDLLQIASLDSYFYRFFLTDGSIDWCSRSHSHHRHGQHWEVKPQQTGMLTSAWATVCKHDMSAFVFSYVCCLSCVCKLLLSWEWVCAYLPVAWRWSSIRWFATNAIQLLSVYGLMAVHYAFRCLLRCLWIVDPWWNPAPHLFANCLMCGSMLLEFLRCCAISVYICWFSHITSASVFPSVCCYAVMLGACLSWLLSQLTAYCCSVQFLFRPADVGQLKSKSAANAVKRMNGAVKIEAQVNTNIEHSGLLANLCFLVFAMFVTTSAHVVYALLSLSFRWLLALIRS